MSYFHSDFFFILFISIRVIENLSMIQTPIKLILRIFLTKRIFSNTLSLKSSSNVEDHDVKYILRFSNRFTEVLYRYMYPIILLSFIFENTVKYRWLVIYLNALTAILKVDYFIVAIIGPLLFIGCTVYRVLVFSFIVTDREKRHWRTRPFTPIIIINQLRR